jgi:hypothetical protein
MKITSSENKVIGRKPGSVQNVNSEVPSIWFIVRLQLLNNLHFVRQQVQLFAQKSVQRHTWYLQFLHA